jgi:lipid-A-disaccharide synthase-like uncharacterized protein
MTSALVIVGLILIILGWLVQLYYSAVRKNFAVSLKFVVIYVVGCILLVIDALQRGQTLIWILNLLAVVIALVAGFFAKKARK